MKKKLLTTLGVVVAVGLIIGIIFMNKNDKLSDKAIDHYQANDSMEIDMTSVTDFDWDIMLVYEHPVTNQDISQALGIKYTKDLDLCYGMIFVKNGKLVYEEKFEFSGDKFETPFKFKIDIDKNLDRHYQVFDKEHAIFNVEEFEFNDSKCYILTPFE